MKNPVLDYRRMIASDLPGVFDVRTSTRENVVTLEDLKTRHGLTPATLTEAMLGTVGGWVCTDSDRIAGFAMGDRATGEVTVVAVLPAYEGLGIGKKVLALVRDWLFESGHEEVWLMATPDPTIRAYGFYRALGWRANGTRIQGEEKMVLRRRP